MTGGEHDAHVGRRTGLLIALLFAVAVDAMAGGTHGVVEAPLHVPWWVLGLAFAATELAVVNIQIRREGHAFTFSEVPLVVGLFLASPASLLAGRLVGCGLVLAVRERQRPTKLLFNLALFSAEVTAAAVVFAVVRAGAPFHDPRAWIAALAAVCVADLLSAVAVTCVIRWHGGPANVTPVVVLTAGTALANTSVGLAAVLLLATNAAAVSLLLVIAVVLFLAYRGYASLIERHQSLELLYEFTRAVGVSSDPADVLDSVLERTRDLMRAETATITLLDDTGTRAVVRATSSADGAERTPGGADPAEDGWVLDAVVARDMIVRIPRDAKDDLRVSYLAHVGAKDLIVAPLHGKEGTIGTLRVTNRLGDLETFRASDARLFETLANHAAVVLENGRLIEALRREVRDREYQALHDHLTGLPNRASFLEHLDASLVAHEPVAVLLIDLDHFKDVNDTLGHQSGDLLLVAVADRLRAAVRDRAFVARLGGDEFAVLATGFGAQGALRFARHVRATLAEPFALDDVSVDAGGSVGVALWPDHASDVPSLLKRADVAMYAAKLTEDGVQLYEPEADHHTVRRLTLSAALREALADGELSVHYQPKARMRDGRIVGAEALVRWTHPQYGVVGPDEFIPIAERAALVGPLTRFVLRAALAERARWHAYGHDLTVSVNLSARSLFDTSFSAQLAELLAESGTPGDRLVFEITESCIMDPTRSEAFLRPLAATGARLSIDDFGTGFSSLSYLHRLPVHEVKVDKSFVLEMASGDTDGSVVRSIIDLGHNLGLHVVAEGVENDIAWGRLRRLGCDTAQGYHLSRPLPADEFVAWVDGRQPASRSEAATPTG